MKSRTLSTIFLVTTLANSLAQSGRVNKRADDQGPLEPVMARLSADMTALKATVQALQAKLGRFLNCELCTIALLRLGKKYTGFSNRLDNHRCLFFSFFLLLFLFVLCLFLSNTLVLQVLSLALM